MQRSPSVVFVDVGGVLATNGWDRTARRDAAEHFGFDWEEFQDRHDFVAHDFETGGLSRDEYLTRTLFYRDRPFTPDEVVAYMEQQTVPFEDTLSLVAELAGNDEVVLATLNNESRELNEYRIERLGLREHFAMFLSSCYLGVTKPEPEIYQLAIDITQHAPGECLFIDDRELNLECARLEGMQTHLFTDAADLRSELDAVGLLG